MRVFTGRVQGKAIVADDGIDLPDGSRVTVIADDEDGFDVTADEEERLLDAMEESDRGDVLPAAELLSRLRR